MIYFFCYLTRKSQFFLVVQTTVLATLHLIYCLNLRKCTLNTVYLGKCNTVSFKKADWNSSETDGLLIKLENDMNIISCWRIKIEGYIIESYIPACYREHFHSFLNAMKCLLLVAVVGALALTYAEDDETLALVRTKEIYV